MKFVGDDLNIHHNKIYHEIRLIRNGSLKIQPDSEINPTNESLSVVPRPLFTAVIKQYSKSNMKGWKSKEIEKAIDILLEEEKGHQMHLDINDGAQLSLFEGQKEYVFNVENEHQNLFFLHGAFHIFRDGSLMKKITQGTDSALYDKLENILNNEDQEIICVFQADDKLDAISNNQYLKSCYSKLKTLKGNLVVLGSALSENDGHIFEQIDNSDIQNVYISTTFFSKKVVDTAKVLFPNKAIAFFDAKTISYNSSMVS